MILDLIFGKLSEIGLNYKKLTSSNIQNEIPEKKVKMQRELEETIKFFQNQSKILKLFGKKNNNKKASNLTQKSEKKKLINNIQNYNNNLIINHNNNNNNNLITIQNNNNNDDDNINNNNDNNNANSNKNKNENENNNLDNNNTQNNGIKKNNQINKINGNINFRLNMVKPETNVKTRTKKKKNKAKKIRRKKINHNMTLNTKIKKEMIKKNVSRSPTKVESIYDNFIFKSQETNNNINNNNNNNNNVNTISTNQKSEINNNFTTPNNFNNNTNNQINQSMIFNQNNPKLYLTSPNLNFLPTPILSQTPPQKLMPTLASTIYQMPSILPMPLPQPIEEQKKSIKGSTTPKSSFKTFPLNNTKQVPKDLPKGNFLENGKQYQNYNSSTLPTMQTPRILGEMTALPNIKYNMNYQKMGISPQTMPTPSNLSFDTQSPMLSPFFPTLSPSPQISPSPINTFFPAITFLPIIQLDQTQQHQFRQQQIKQQQQQIKQQQQQIKQQQLKQQQQQQQIKQQQIKLRQQSKQQQPQLQQNTHFQQLLQQEYSFPSFPFFNRSTAFPPNFKPIKNIQNQNVKLDQKKTKKEDKK
ncbi:inactive non-canonical poly(a) RNA polymerase protein trf4-2-related [Anaeramoeba flamelloides]|uniref:Inactive non-canonical poly(A) RNA polymerase protein trf4-2-related n=1 Tax=Anaeramoeba flamelloides TaxID=1746091 RepID=A0AAV7Z7B1_9EUKA|nr:inactive non-canonical poly(a) RNA polymerase protein trf4-2-related [Anaeramoeba flamelloides]